MKINTVIVDLGTGNLRSVSKALEYVAEGNEVLVSSDPEQIRDASHLVLPGQGAIGTWFDQLNENSILKSAVIDRLKNGPVLGICLGLQSLYGFSDESGGVAGLELLAGRVRHFTSHEIHAQAELGSKLKIPHMGWNQVSQVNTHPLWEGIADGERFYFVHSYYAESHEADQIMGKCCHGNFFTAAAGRDNLFATQFHPEKSQDAGLRLLKNFLNWNGSV